MAANFVQVRIDVPRRGSPKALSFTALLPRVPSVGEGVSPDGFCDLQVKAVTYVERVGSATYQAVVRLDALEDEAFESLRARRVGRASIVGD